MSQILLAWADLLNHITVCITLQLLFAARRGLTTLSMSDPLPEIDYVCLVTKSSSRLTSTRY